MQRLLSTEKTHAILALRGAVGENILLWAVLHMYPACSSDQRTFVENLIAAYPELIGIPYEGPLYAGETLLHLAAVHGDIGLVQTLVEQYGADFETPRATGAFFSPKSRAYYGESVLNFAVCRGFVEVVEYLLVAGADPNASDSFENTPLHFSVIHNQPRVYRLLLSYGADPTYLNSELYTPLTLAIRVNRSEMFDVILESTKHVNWSWAGITNVTYPLIEWEDPLPLSLVNSSVATASLASITTLPNLPGLPSDPDSAHRPTTAATAATAAANTTTPRSVAHHTPRSVRNNRHTPRSSSRRHRHGRKNNTFYSTVEAAQSASAAGIELTPKRVSFTPTDHRDHRDRRDRRDREHHEQQEEMDISSYEYSDDLTNPSSPPPHPPNPPNPLHPPLTSEPMVSAFSTSLPPSSLSSASSSTSSNDDDTVASIVADLSGPPSHQSPAPPLPPPQPHRRAPSSGGASSSQTKTKSWETVRGFVESRVSRLTHGLKHTRGKKKRRGAFRPSPASMDLLRTRQPRDKKVLALMVRHGRDDLVFRSVTMRLLQLKWYRFARIKFFKSLVADLLFLVLFTIQVGMFPGELKGGYFEAEDTSDKFRIGLELTNLLLCIVYIAMDVREAIMSTLPLTEYASSAMTSTVSLRWMFLAIVPFALFARLIHEPVMEQCVLATAIIAGWCSLLYYCRGLQSLGPLVITIWNILIRDLIRFTAVFLIFAIAFAQALYVCVKFRDIEGYDWWGGALIEIFAAGTGANDFDYKTLGSGGEDGAYPMAIIVYIGFDIVVIVLMLNMLIAMMNDTYTSIAENAQKQWALQWASIILDSERKMDIQTRAKVQLGTVDKNGVRGYTMTLPFSGHELPLWDGFASQLWDAIRFRDTHLIEPPHPAFYTNAPDEQGERFTLIPDEEDFSIVSSPSPSRSRSHQRTRIRASDDYFRKYRARSSSITDLLDQ